MAPPLPPPTTSAPRQRLKTLATRLRARFGSRGLSWGAITVSTVAAFVASWPLAAAIWDLLGFTTGQAVRVSVLGACALLLTAGIARLNRGRTVPVRLIWLILGAWTVAAGAIAIMTGLAWVVLGAPQWAPPGEITPRGLDSIATRAFAIVAGLGGVALLVISYRRQRTTETSDQREETKLFNERFTTAYTELGHEHAAVRLGAVHALAHLADDAPEGREELVQTVIDVLCAYLRMPYEPVPDPLPKNANKARREEHRERELTFAAMREVRHTIIRIIGNHLREDTRWRGKDYDFTGAVFDGGNLSGAVFSEGEVYFNNTHFVDGKFSFTNTKFTGAKVFFHDAQFSGGELSFAYAQFTAGALSFTQAQFIGGKVSFFGSVFMGSAVSFTLAQFASGAVSFFASHFASGMVSFTKAHFTGSKVAFTSAQFAGGRVQFSEAHFTDGRVSFFGVSGPPPDGLLEAKEKKNSRTILYTPEWT